jgi:hypothetical protein
MRLKHLYILTVSLSLAACTIDKGDSDSDSSSSSASATDSASSAPSTTDAPSTGEPTGTSDPGTGTTGTGESNQPCIDTPTILSLDESSALGFSAAQLLADKLGKRSTTLTFAGEPTVLSDDLKNKQLPLEVELRHNGGEVRLIDASPNPDFDDSGNDSGFVECSDRLEVDIEIDFVTAAKEFDERRKGTLTATTVDRADLRVELAPPDSRATSTPPPSTPTPNGSSPPSNSAAPGRAPAPAAASSTRSSSAATTASPALARSPAGATPSTPDPSANSPPALRQPVGRPPTSLPGGVDRAAGARLMQ